MKLFLFFLIIIYSTQILLIQNSSANNFPPKSSLFNFDFEDFLNSETDLIKVEYIKSKSDPTLFEMRIAPKKDNITLKVDYISESSRLNITCEKREKQTEEKPGTFHKQIESYSSSMSSIQLAEGSTLLKEENLAGGSKILYFKNAKMVKGNQGDDKTKPKIKNKFEPLTPGQGDINL